MHREKIMGLVLLVAGCSGASHGADSADDAGEAAPALAQESEQAETNPQATEPSATNQEKERSEKNKRDPLADKTVWKVPVAADDPVKGGEAPLVTIVQFAEFQCPFSERVRTTLDQVFAKYGDDVRLVWKDNPLGFHPQALPAALLARTVYQKHGNDEFWKVQDALFDSQPHVANRDLKRIARESGVSWKPIRDPQPQRLTDKIDESQDLATDLKAHGTPTFFVNGRRLLGAQPYEVFEKLIDEQLAKAKQLVEQGTPRAQIYATLMKDAQEPQPFQQKQVTAPQKDSPVRGNASAPILIQEFGNYRCPYSARAESTIKKVLERHPNQVRLVFRHYPLPLASQEQAPLASEAAHEIYVQLGNEAYWNYHEALYERLRAPGGLGREHLERLAEDLGADMKKFQTALDRRTHRERVNADVEAAKAAGFEGTPTFVVGDYVISGAQAYRVFERAIELTAERE